MRKTLHVGRHVILFHQVIPHGAGLTDVLTDLYQFAHHLRPEKKRKVVYGCGFQIGNKEYAEKDCRIGEQISVRKPQTGLKKGRKGVGQKLTGHRGWHIYKLA